MLPSIPFYPSFFDHLRRLALEFRREDHAHANKLIKTENADITSLIDTSILDSLSVRNDPPTPDEADTLRSQCRIGSSTIKSLDAEIDQLRTRSMELRQTREQWGGRMTASMRVLHPIRLLSDEMLAIVFRFCVDEDIRTEELMANLDPLDDCSPPTLDVTKSPWVLGQVCRRWRRVALSTPRLWNMVEINFQRAKGPIIGPHLFFTHHLLPLRLARVQNQPLSISLNLPTSDGNIIPPILWSKLSQWKNLTIRSPMLYFGYLTRCANRLSNLSCLHLHFKLPPQDEIPNHRFGIYGIFQNTPNLRQLTLSGNVESMSFLSMEFPWKQITYFTTRNIIPPCHSSAVFRTDFYFQILPLLKNVQECSLVPISFHTETYRSLTLPKLHRLVFTGPKHGIATLTDYLDLPALRSLRFDNLALPEIRICPIRHRVNSRSLFLMISTSIPKRSPECSNHPICEVFTQSGFLLV
ncbi:hypothetical protein E1B28_009561 [Marasmius oreades]|uniref:F-box domain-containing protein n=1 Tax=Marasmius oreades TaxID=181124 RepID=A0A9P7RVY8_9AGAR|nr:uncharacterized protein E1B28_009561 [Marasmius oreades]KAG7090443.1 hypothetical protein E1B28_009561 [Marasmius oreades]